MKIYTKIVDFINCDDYLHMIGRPAAYNLQTNSFYYFFNDSEHRINGPQLINNNDNNFLGYWLYEKTIRINIGKLVL